MSSVVCKRLLVTGKVQGVGFRASTLREATRIAGLRGWVRNLPDGRVEIMVQGDQSKVHELVEWSYSGPPASQVANVEVEDTRVEPALGEFAIKK